MDTDDQGAGICHSSKETFFSRCCVVGELDTGEIPDELSKMAAMVHLDVSGNNLTGEKKGNGGDNIPCQPTMNQVRV